MRSLWHALFHRKKYGHLEDPLEYMGAIKIKNTPSFWCNRCERRYWL